MTGYSGTPLVRKLGYKAGHLAFVQGAPEHYPELLIGLPEKVAFTSNPQAETLDIVHVFVMSQDALAQQLPILRTLIKPAGMIWVSWPKKASKVATDMSEDVVRANAFPLQLVDVKVCAVDAVWSGLKLVIRKEYR